MCFVLIFNKGKHTKRVLVVVKMRTIIGTNFKLFTAQVTARYV